MGAISVPPLNRAARLMAGGVGGQVLASGSTAAVLSPGADFELVDMGSHRFRGLTDPIRVFSVRSEGLAFWDHPLTTTAAGNLPLSPTRWVGRTDELRERSSALAEGHTVLTLTGSGGVGKSRLAVELARLAVPGSSTGRGWWSWRRSASRLRSFRSWRRRCPSGPRRG